MSDAPLSVGAYGDSVASVHSLLAKQGVPLPTSEVARQFFGPATRQAVQQVQKSQGLPVTGAVDESTLSALSVVGASGGKVGSTRMAAGLAAAGTIVSPTRAPVRPPNVMNIAAPRINLQRIPATFDPLGVSDQGTSAQLQPFRVAAATKVFGGMKQIQDNMGQLVKALQQPALPGQLIGALHQPDGSAAVRVQVQFDPSSVGVNGAVLTTLAADDGSFKLNMPKAASTPDAGISLTVHGATNNVVVNIAAAQIAANGMVGVILLPAAVTPLPVSILASLKALEPADAPSPATPAPDPGPSHSVTIGEAGSGCSQSFAASATTDSFPWGVFFRLIEPRMSIVTQVQPVPLGDKRSIYLPHYQIQYAGSLGSTQATPTTATTFLDRVPVDQPLSVDGFKDQVSGIDTLGSFTAAEQVPMAASLGLGYVLWLSQRWTFKGLGLGDLVYSLPLAPGEQQQVAVFERRDSSTVRESEFFSESEAMTQTALADTSTNATFTSAFREAESGGSKFRTDSSSESWGATCIFASGGGGSSTSTGSTSAWMQGQRDTTQQAAQSTHSSAENQASARRTANRTGMRLATSSESMGITTKTITNHNHTRALTMQYWEVLRMFDVTTAVDGLTLTCLVPMQIVRFMPPGQPAILRDPYFLVTRADVLERYGRIVRHLDILQDVVPRRFQYGLTLLAQFASDPTADVDTAFTVAEDVIEFELHGTFLSCENVSVAAVTRRNTRVGPVMLSPKQGNQPTEIPGDTFGSREDLLGWLTNQRQGVSVGLQGSLALPSSMNRADVIGFEISRQFKTVNYTLLSPEMQALKALQGMAGNVTDFWDNALKSLPGSSFAARVTVHLSPSDLESLVGGPTVESFRAAIQDIDASGVDSPKANETYANDTLQGTILPPQPFPVPAVQIAPILRYREILEIEKAAQHIVRNTTEYSRALWLSLSMEERAILLDGYTIGVPTGGVEDPSEMVPLLNCVQNKVLGTFGNSLIMPFIIPQDVADQMGIDPAKLQQALLTYQRASFTPPHSTIALPTRGVLGEGVLGHCPSAEKIDLTRFWNWQDAPADTAPGIGMVQMPTTTPPLTTGVTAPNSLTNLPPLINNLITAPAPNTSLLQAMGQQAASQPDFNQAIMGQQQLASMMQNGQSLANQARADALKTTQMLNSQAMATVGNIVGSMYGNSTAGSSAASSVNNSTQPPLGNNATTQKATTAKPDPTTTPKAAGGTKPAATTTASSDSAPAQPSATDAGADTTPAGD